MASKKHRPEEAVAKLRQVDVLVSQGQSVAEAIRAIGVTEVTYYRWRREFGGLKADQVKRLKDLEAENARLRKAVADLTLDKRICQEFCVWDRVDQVMAKRSSKRMANCALAAAHSLRGIFQSFEARFNTRYSSFSAASSCGKWPRARTARRSLALSDSMALVV